MQEHDNLVPNINTPEPSTPMHAMSFTDIIDGMFTLYRSHFSLYLGIGIVYIVIGFVRDQTYMYILIKNGMQDAPAMLFYSFLSTFLTFLLSLFINGALVYATSQVFLEKNITVRNALQEPLKCFIPLLGSSLLWILVVFGTFVTIIGIPFSIYFAVLWGLYGVPILFEKTSATAAFRRSAELVKGSWWRVLGIMVAIFIIWVMLSIILQTTFQLIFSFVSGTSEVENPTFLESIRLAFLPNPNDIGWFMYSFRALVSLSLAALLMPIGSIGSTLLYFDLRIRKEAYDIEMQVTN